MAQKSAKEQLNDIIAARIKNLEGIRRVTARIIKIVNTQKQIDIIIFVDVPLSQALNRTKAQLAGTEAAVEAIEIIRERTKRYDVNYRKLPPLSRLYKRFKAKYAANRIKYRKRSGKRYRNLQNTTEFKAKGVPNHGRLTGQFFAAMTPETPVVRPGGGGFQITLRLKLKGKLNIAKAGYLKDMHRDVWGINEKREGPKILQVFTKKLSRSINQRRAA